MTKEIKKKHEMYLITAPCWNCGEDVLLALVGSRSGNFYYGPEKFTNAETAVARKHGVYLKIIDSKTANEIYLANACRKCDKFFGKWHHFAHYFAPTLYSEYEYKIVDVS